MKSFLFGLLATLVVGSAFGQSATINLPTLATVTLTPEALLTRCSAETARANALAATVTGFSADGNYVLGQEPARWVCGHSGRGSDLKYYDVCAQFVWDLSGNIVSVTATPGSDSNGNPVSVECPVISLLTPPPGPPASSVVGNEFANPGGYIAQTLVVRACGTVGCYAVYDYPELLTP